MHDRAVTRHLATSVEPTAYSRKPELPCSSLNYSGKVNTSQNVQTELSEKLLK